MPYTDHFRLVDDVTAHFDAAVAASDPFIQSRYVGFYAIAATSVVEIALKEIIVSFAAAQNELFGNYVQAKYEQINARVRISAIVGEHLAPFGERYQSRFKNLLDELDDLELKRRRFAVKASYGNLLQCRHMFAHQGSIPVSSTYSEVKRGFESGKLVLSCLSATLSDS